MCDTVYEYAMTSPLQDMDTTKGTLFGAYNSVTGYFQNVRSYKDSESKLKSILFGGTAQLCSQAALNRKIKKVIFAAETCGTFLFSSAIKRKVGKRKMLLPEGNRWLNFFRTRLATSQQPVLAACSVFHSYLLVPPSAITPH